MNLSVNIKYLDGCSGSQSGGRGSRTGTRNQFERAGATPDWDCLTVVLTVANRWQCCGKKSIFVKVEVCFFLNGMDWNFEANFS